MTSAPRKQSKANAEQKPDQLIAMLRYALPDVRAMSERSARYLEASITTLVQDTSVVVVQRQDEKAD
jgi:hypothetical protein